jgi:hypothetical protein
MIHQLHAQALCSVHALALKRTRVLVQQCCGTRAERHRALKKIMAVLRVRSRRAPRFGHVTVSLSRQRSMASIRRPDSPTSSRASPSIPHISPTSGRSGWSPKNSAKTRIGCSTVPARWSPKTASYGSIRDRGRRRYGVHRLRNR